MKRKVYLPITIVLAIGLIVLVLVLNKKSTTAKTQDLLAEEAAVAVRTEVVSESNSSYSSMPRRSEPMPRLVV